MYCRQCGAELTEGVAYCGSCGASQAVTAAPAKNIASGRYETKVIQVHPDYEDAAIKKFELFGWECAQSQTVKTKDSHLEQGFGDSIVSVTETETFVKLTFKRQLNLANYDRLKELEEQYDDAGALGDPPRLRSWPTIVGVILIILGVLGLTTNPGGVVGIVGGIALTIYGAKRKKEDMEAVATWHKEHEEAEMIKYNCEEEAKKLL